MVLKKIEIFLLNLIIAPQVPCDGQKVREEVLSDTKNKELINGMKQHEGSFYYQLPKEKYVSVIGLINSIHIAPFGNHITESEKKNP